MFLVFLFCFLEERGFLIRGRQTLFDDWFYSPGTCVFFFSFQLVFANFKTKDRKKRNSKLAVLFFCFEFASIILIFRVIYFREVDVG